MKHLLSLSKEKYNSTSPKRTLKVLHLTTIHECDDIRIFRKEARSLAANGYEVHLLAPAHNRKIKEGVVCHPLTPGMVTRILFPGFSRLLRVSEALLKTIKIRPRLLHFHDPELIPIAVLAKVLLRIPVIYDVHENYPELFRVRYGSRRLYATIGSFLLKIFEAMASRCLDAFVAATPKIAQRFPTAKTVTVLNYPILPADLPPVDDINRQDLIIHSGQIIKEYSAFEMVRAMQHLSHPHAHLLLLGPVQPPQLLEELKKEQGFMRVTYLGKVPPEQVMSYLRRARIGLVLYHPTPDNLEALPNKIFEYMAAGLAIVASNFPYWERILSQVGAGVTADPLDPRSIAAQISWLLDHPQEVKAMGRAGQEAVCKQFNWQVEEKKLLDLYQKLLT